MFEYGDQKSVLSQRHGFGVTEYGETWALIRIVDGVTAEKGLTIMFSRLEEEEKIQLKHKRANKVLPKPNEKREK